MAAVATALWVVIVVAFLATAREDGVNIGAALLAFLALPLSIAASVTLVVSWRSDVEARRPDDHRRAGRIGAGLAVAAIVCLAGSLVLGPMVDGVELAVAAAVVLVVGIVTFVASSVLFALPRGRRG